MLVVVGVIAAVSQSDAGDSPGGGVVSQDRRGTGLPPFSFKFLGSNHSNNHPVDAKKEVL